MHMIGQETWYFGHTTISKQGEKRKGKKVFGKNNLAHMSHLGYFLK
jgi:hypothetical protein